MDLPNKDRMCHLTGFCLSCRDLVTEGKCERWVNVQGQNPQTGEIINRFGCIDDWQTTLMIENSKLLRETGAAIESFRNEMVTANQQTAVLLSHDLRQHLTQAASRPMLEVNGRDDDDPG